MRFAEIVRNSGRKLSLFGNIISGVLFLAALLVVSLAFLVNATYNPFLYFRF